jgi:hypothetical protein
MLINENIKRLLERNSSMIDFCEENKYESYFIEYYNTISSFLFCILGFIIIYNNMKNNMKNNKIRKNIYGVLLVNVGIFSGYFHGTLSEFGHIMDIMAIWLIILYMDYVILKREIKEVVIMILGNIIISMIIPILSIIILFTYGLYINRELKRVIKEVELYERCKKMFYVSIIFWIMDFIICDYLRENYMATHYIFHIIIAIMAYKISKILD